MDAGRGSGPGLRRRLQRVLCHRPRGGPRDAGWGGAEGDERAPRGARDQGRPSHPRPPLRREPEQPELDGGARTLRRFGCAWRERPELQRHQRGHPCHRRPHPVGAAPRRVRRRELRGVHRIRRRQHLRRAPLGRRPRIHRGPRRHEPHGRRPAHPASHRAPRVPGKLAPGLRRHGRRPAARRRCCESAALRRRRRGACHGRGVLRVLCGRRPAAGGRGRRGVLGAGRSGRPRLHHWVRRVLG
mmetsp:Transcript_25018/g.75171  ORF Transcript_25018/g.75171 Transcript_25018/m.75171 type:complete len:243 (+) Transcript_25018:1725-2453(+)